MGKGSAMLSPELLQKAFEESEAEVLKWQRIANERLRAIWIMASAAGGRVSVGRSIAENYPGDDRAVIFTHTDPQFGDFVIEARQSP